MPEHSVSKPQDISSSTTEMGLKDFILEAIELFNYLLRRWKFFVLLGFIGGVIGYISAYTRPSRYTAELTFVVEDAKSSGGLGSYAGLASQFGIDLSGGDGAGLFQGDNILELLKSRLLVQKALLKPYPTDTSKTLGDILFLISGKKKDWDKNERTKNIKFPTNQNQGQLSLLQDSALEILHTYLLAEVFSVNKIDKKMSFIKSVCISEDEFFSSAFVTNLVKEATDFYIELKTKKSKANVDNLQHKADSLLAVINQKSFSAAVSQDMNPNPARRVATIGMEMNNRDKIVAQTVYGEVVKNLEISKMTMAQEKPLIQIVDMPLRPLIKSRPSKIFASMIGMLISVTVLALILTLRHYLKLLLSKK